MILLMALIFEDSVVDYASESPLSPELDLGAPDGNEPVQPTELAVRYGVSEHRMFKNTGKSPLLLFCRFIQSPCSFTPREHCAERRFMSTSKEISCILLHTWELVDSGCWMDPEATPCSLDEVQIHPMYQQAQWLDGNIPLGKGMPGLWEDRNPVVWKAIEPSLKLATLFLQAAQKSPWVDALLFGARQKVPDDELAFLPPDGVTDFSVHLRTREEFIQNLGSQLHWFDRLLPIMRRAVASARVESPCHMTPNSSFNIGGEGYALPATTRWFNPDPSKRIITALHLELLEPLLRNDLTSSERLAQQLLVANCVSDGTLQTSVPVNASSAERWEFEQTLRIRLDVLQTWIRKQEQDQVVYERDVEFVKKVGSQTKK